MATMEILDRLGATQVVEKPLPPGPAADTLSRPVAFSTQDRALLGATTEPAPASDTASSGHNGRLVRIAQNVTAGNTALVALSGQFPSDLDDKARLRIGAMTVDENEIPLVFIKSIMVTGQNALSTTASIVIDANSERMFAEITNDDTTIKIYVGGDETVSTITGHVLKPGASMTFDGYIGDIWCRAASGTPTVTFMTY